MSIDNLAAITSLLPSQRAATAPKVGNASLSTVVENTDSVASAERQGFAVNGQYPSVNLVTENHDNKEDKLDSAVSDINSFVQTISRKLEFTVNESLPLGRSVIKVIDSETDKVIREIPSEDAIELAKRIREQFDDNLIIDGFIFTDQA